MTGGEWGIYIVLYFWLAGFGGGAFLLALSQRDRWLQRVGAWLAFLGVVVGALLLVIDLGQPLRFWHLLASFRPVSVMWLGSAFLFLDGIALFLLLFLRQWPPLLVWAAAILTLLVVGYTGVLLTATARPFWAASPLIPWIFLASAGTTGAAVLALFGAEAGVHRAAFWLAWVEGALILLHLVWTYPSATPAVQALLSGSLAWAFWGFVAFGFGIPIWLEARKKGLWLAALLVLAGGFLLRYFVVYAGQVGYLI